MAIWRNHDLEQILAGPLDATGLNEAAVRRLVDRQVAESDQLDYKLTAPSSSAPTDGKGWLNDFAKDVAAFANGRGGLLLYGVRENDKVPEEVVGLRGLNLDAIEGALVATLTKFVSPIPDFAVIVVPFDGADPCMAVVVPPSSWAPHGVSSAARGSERRPLDYPVRAAAHTRWMTEPEIASRYLERGKTAAFRETRIRKLIDEAKGRLAASDSTWVYLAVMPERPVEVAMTSQFVDMAISWLPAVGATSPLRASHLTLSRSVVAPGRVILTDFPFQGDPAWMSGIYVELHTDGAAFVAVDGLYRAERPRKNNRELDLLSLVDSLILAAQLAPRWARDQAGSIGAATLLAGVACHLRGVTAQFDLHQSLPGGRHYRVPTALGMMHQDPQMTTPIDLAGLDGAQGELIIARKAGSGILQWFGIVEPLQITADGRLAIEHWAGGPDFGNEQQASQWSQAKLPPPGEPL